MSLRGFVHFYIWNRPMACRKNCCRFLPSATQEQVAAARQPSTHCHIACRNAGMLSAMLGVTDKWHLSRSFFAGPLKWRENNGAKMTSWSRKEFPVRVSETKLVKITFPCFKSLTAADLCRKDDFDLLFNFQGPVISECTIMMRTKHWEERNQAGKTKTQENEQGEWRKKHWTSRGKSVPDMLCKQANPIHVQKGQTRFKLTTYNLEEWKPVAKLSSWFSLHDMTECVQTRVLPIRFCVVSCASTLCNLSRYFCAKYLKTGLQEQ